MHEDKWKAFEPVYLSICLTVENRKNIFIIDNSQVEVQW